MKLFGNRTREKKSSHLGIFSFPDPGTFDAVDDVWAIVGLVKGLEA